MRSNTNLIIGTVVAIVVVVAAYFMLSGEEGSAPQANPPAPTQPKS